MSLVRVAVAVVYVGEKVLIAKRPLDKNQGGLWEFPGGKIEADENPQTALLRELQEEVGVDFSSASITPLMILPFTYPEIQVQLEVFSLVGDEFALVNAYGAEGQEIRWVRVKSLVDYDFPEANKAILKAVEHQFNQK